MPSIRLLKAFTAIADNGNFRRAADHIGLTQPALSLQIKDLEDRLGVTLLERKPGKSARDAMLTPAGAALLPRARAILNAMRDFQQSALAMGAPLYGRLRLGVIPTIGPYLLPTLLPLLQEHYPTAQLEVTEDKTDNLITALRDGAIDVALLALPISTHEFAEQTLFEDEFHLIVPRAHPLAKQATPSAADIMAAPLLLLDDGHCLRDQALSFCRVPQAKTQTSFKAASLQTLTELVANGLGATFLPAMALAREIKPSHKLKSRKLPGASRQIGLIWRKNHPNDESYVALGKLIKKAAKA